MITVYWYLFANTTPGSAGYRSAPYSDKLHAPYQQDGYIFDAVIPRSEYCSNTKYWSTPNIEPVPTVRKTRPTRPGNSVTENQYLVLVRYGGVPIHHISKMTASSMLRPQNLGSVSTCDTSSKLSRNRSHALWTYKDSGLPLLRPQDPLSKAGAPHTPCTLPATWLDFQSYDPRICFHMRLEWLLAVTV